MGPFSHSHLAVKLPEVLRDHLLVPLARGELGRNSGKVLVDLALLDARLLEGLGALRGVRRPTVQMEDELLGELGDGAAEDDDLLAALVLLSARARPLKLT
jgi:hypothetical protein